MIYLHGVIVGVFAGGAYSLVAVSVTLMFRSTGVLSFAHAAFAAVGAYVYADLAGSRGWSAPLAAAVALLITIVYGVVVERLAIRPVRRASATAKLIVTLGVLSATTGLILQVYGFAPRSAPLLLPDEVVRLGDLRIAYQQVAILVVAGGLSVGLGLFLQRSRFGTAVRAVAENGEAAELMGVSLIQVARFNWMVGAALAGLTGILIAPLSVITGATFPLLLARALTATLFGGLVSLPLTFLGGLGVGVVQSLTVIKSSTPGAQDFVTMLLVVALLLLKRSWPAELVGDTFASTASVRSERFTSLSSAANRAYRRGRPLFLGAAVVGAAVAVIVPAQNNYWGFVGARGLFYVIEALSIVLLVGWAGQVSLMHGAYVGIGAFTTAYLISTYGMPLPVAVLLAAVAGTLMGAVAGLPALRLTGLQFGIASLVFGAAASEWLFKRPEFPHQISRSTFFGLDLFSDSNLYLVMLPITLLLYVLVWNVRRSTFGPLLIVSRDASPTVAHFGASPKRTRMAAFLFASFIASLGGALYGVLLTGFQPFDFSFLLSTQLLIYAVVGGSQTLGGPIVAGLLFGVIPQIVQGQSGASASAVPDIVAGVVLVALMALRPAGLASLLTAGRAAAARVARPFVTGRFDIVIARHRTGNGRTASTPVETEPTPVDPAPGNSAPGPAAPAAVDRPPPAVGPTVRRARPLVASTRRPQ